MIVSLVLQPGDARPYGIEPLVDVLIAPVYLVDVVDAARTVGTHGGDEQRDTGPDIGRHHVGSPQRGEREPDR